MQEEKYYFEYSTYHLSGLNFFLSNPYCGVTKMFFDSLSIRFISNKFISLLNRSHDRKSSTYATLIKITTYGIHLPHILL